MGLTVIGGENLWPTMAYEPIRISGETQAPTTQAKVGSAKVGEAVVSEE